MPTPATPFSFSTATRPAKGEVLIVPLAADPPPAMQLLRRVDQECGGAVGNLVRVAGVGAEAGQMQHTAGTAGYRRVLLVSLGPAAGITAALLRRIAGSVGDWLLQQGVERAALWIDGLVKTQVERPVAAWADGMVLGGFRFNRHKSAAPAVGRCRIGLAAGEAARKVGRAERVSEAVALAQSVNYARSLCHEPGNIIQPSSLAKEARRLAREWKLKCTVFGPADLKKMKMGGLIAVGQGAADKPCLIRLDYRGAPRSRQSTALIGKAVTFDTGGYSLKPKDGLESMKFDKCGGMAVLGIMHAAAALKLRCNLTALVPAAENAVSGEAYRPGDIITMMSGKTVEIISADAEGRLILADALTYAQKHCKPTRMINFATLTGGVVISLGRAAAGLMGNNDELAADLEESGRRSGERLWRLPLWDEYRDLIRGNDSDIRNSATRREAHAIVGGMFLKEFVDASTPWAHLDIAGTAINESKTAATGYGVRLIVDYLRRHVEGRR